MNLNKDFHPLFLPEPDGPDDYEPRAFSRIKVIRVRADGPLRRTESPYSVAMRLYTPEEIPDLQTFHAIFGGGKYEVRAIMDNGQFYCRRYHECTGDSKPLEQTQETAGQPAAVPFSQTPGLDPMMQLMFGMMEKNSLQMMTMMMTFMQTNQQSQTALMTGMFQALASLGGNKENVSELMRGWAEMVKAAAPPVPPGPPVDPIDGMKKAMELKKLIREDDEAAQKPPEETTTQVIKTVAEMAAPFIMKGMEIRAEQAAAAAANTVTMPMPPAA